MTVFWDVAPYSIEEIYRRFRDTASIITEMMEAVSTSETTINF
jgi:hypothetical protein